MKTIHVSRPLLTLATSALLMLAARADQFTLFVYESPSDFAARTDQEKAPGYWGGYGAIAKEMTEAGVLRGGSALHADDQAKTVRAKGGVSSCAAAKAPEVQLGGYFILEVADMDAALKWAAKFPAATTGAVEVRPHFPNPQMPAAK